MNSSGNWITHKDTNVLLNDYRDMTPDVFLIALQTNQEFISGCAPASVRVLLDLRGNAAIGADKRVLAKMKDAALALRPFIERAAVLGLSPIQNSFLSFIVSLSKIPINSFDNQNQALDWLVATQ